MHAHNLGERPAITKQRDDVPADFFAAEARGLDALRSTQALRVPAVYSVTTHCIVLEDLGHGQPASDYWQRAGTGLARQHLACGDRFGFNHDGYCGDSPQDNTTDADGWRFFAMRRLLPQTRRARDCDLIEPRDAMRIERLCASLHERIPEMPSVLLHGDLWTGNLHVCGDGSPALIDAGAVHYSWAEADLAMLVLFGSPPAAFFSAYAEHAPLRIDWRERVPLYNLYHLLNHMNLFGVGYLATLRAAIAACA